MSYARLHHDNPSRLAVQRSKSSSSASSHREYRTDSASGSETDVWSDAQKHSLEEYELRELSPSLNGKAESFRQLHDDSHGSDGEGEGGGDDDDDDEPHADKIRRGSASTTQSFMLYTPDEERAVIRKFDRKLVLFVAFLYMLSFLDRSSSPPRPAKGGAPADCSQTSAMRGSLACTTICT